MYIFFNIPYSLSMKVHKLETLMDDICDDLNTYDFFTHVALVMYLKMMSHVLLMYFRSLLKYFPLMISLVNILR
jgi:hypothetical protein